MANINGAFGLRPIAKLGQGSNSTGFTGYTPYEIASDNSNRIYQGMPVIPLSTGFIDRVGAAAGGSVSLVGAFMGCEFVSSTTCKVVFSNNWPGSGADSNHPVKAFVADNPNQLFKVASDATLTDRATALTGVFANASLGTSARTGSTNTGNSNSALSVSSIATTATLPLRIVGIMDDEANNDFTAAGIPLIVRINAHFNATTSRFDSQTTATTTGV